MRARGPTHHIRDRIAHHDPRCLIAYWVVAGAQLQLRAHPAVFEGSCIASPRSAHGMMPRIYGLIQQSAACDRRSQPKCGLNAAPNVALQAGHRIASQLDLRLRRQAVGFGHGGAHVCRNQRVVRAGLVSGAHGRLGVPKRPGRPFHRDASHVESDRRFKAPWQARPGMSRGCYAQHVRRGKLVIGCSRDGRPKP